MKATVLSSKNGRSVILTENGTFRDVAGTYSVGAVIKYDEKAEILRSRNKSLRKLARVAACLLLALLVGFYSYNYLVVFAEVTLESTPGIKYSLNHQGEVIGIKALKDTQKDTVNKLIRHGAKGKKLNEVANIAGNITGKEDPNGSNSPKVHSKKDRKEKAQKDMADIKEKKTVEKKQENKKPGKNTDTKRTRDKGQRQNPDRPGKATDQKHQSQPGPSGKSNKK